MAAICEINDHAEGLIFYLLNERSKQPTLAGKLHLNALLAESMNRVNCVIYLFDLNRFSNTQKSNFSFNPLEFSLFTPPCRSAVAENKSERIDNQRNRCQSEGKKRI